MEICDRKECTACGACVNVCPNQCIVWCKDDYDTLYPNIDEGKCIECKACFRVCHNNNNNLKFNKPQRAYAAWSLDKDNRKTSASGGVTSVLYRNIIKKGGFTTGVELTRKKGAHYIIIKNEDDIKRVKNSKYVFSHTNDIFKVIKQEVKNGRLVFFVGLPCQVAALKTYLGQLSESNNLLLADLLCHGIVNEDYLFEYLQDIETEVGVEADEVCFRDPVFGTERYRFTLRAKHHHSSRRILFHSSHDEDAIIYNQSHTDKNLYMMGYMGNLIFRENCYQCHYAKTERVGDLTFGDFDGLGIDIPCNYSRKKVSLILVNTDRGDKVIKQVSNELFLEERNISEAINHQTQLREPTKGHSLRPVFLKKYSQTHDFTKSAQYCLKAELKNNRKINNKKRIKKLIKSFIPISMIKKTTEAFK